MTGNTALLGLALCDRGGLPPPARRKSQRASATCRATRATVLAPSFGPCAIGSDRRGWRCCPSAPTSRAGSCGTSMSTRRRPSASCSIAAPSRRRVLTGAPSSSPTRRGSPGRSAGIGVPVARRSFTIPVRNGAARCSSSSVTARMGASCAHRSLWRIPPGRRRIVRLNAVRNELAEPYTAVGAISPQERSLGHRIPRLRHPPVSGRLVCWNRLRQTRPVCYSWSFDGRGGTYSRDVRCR